MTLTSQKAAAGSSTLMLYPGQAIPNEDGTPFSENPASASGTSKATSVPSATTVPSAALAPSHSKHLSTGAIAGIAVGGALVVILLAAFVFLLGRHTSMMQTFKRLHHPGLATPGSHNSRAHFPPDFEPPYSGGFASPRSDTGQYAPPYGAPYQPHTQPGQMSELSSAVEPPIHKGLGIQRDQILAHEDSRQQTISPPLVRYVWFSRGGWRSPVYNPSANSPGSLKVPECNPTSMTDPHTDFHNDKSKFVWMG